MCLLLLNANVDLSCPSSVALGRAIQLIDVLRDASPYAKMEQTIGSRNREIKTTWNWAIICADYSGIMCRHLIWLWVHRRTC
ncbi:hypothetical protein ACHAWX_003652 [Stephanocyclus meneghinianus]